MTQTKNIQKAPGVDRGAVLQAALGGARSDFFSNVVCLIEIYEKPRLAEFDKAECELAHWLGRKKQP